MRRNQLIFTIPFVVLLASCETTGANYQPVVDGSVGPNYSNDLAQCQNLAASQGNLSSNTAAQVATGAGIAAAGTAIISNKGHNVRDAALVGALVGVTASALDQNSNKETIVRNCMRQRGYNVVG